MLTLIKARIMADATLAEGEKLDLAPLTVVVLDAGGHVLVVQRHERAGILRAEIAHAKAWGSLGMGFGSRELMARAAKMPEFFAALSGVSGGRMAPSPGGLLIIDGSGRTIGAIGVSGDMGDKDELCALAGLQAAELHAP